MENTTILFVLAVGACIYMACNIGANDVANAMGTTVGSKTLTYKQAIFIAAVAEFAGSFLAGGNVSDSVRKGMIDPNVFSFVPLHLVFGMIAALLASSIWLQRITKVCFYFDFIRLLVKLCDNKKPNKAVIFCVD